MSSGKPVAWLEKITTERLKELKGVTGLIGSDGKTVAVIVPHDQYRLFQQFLIMVERGLRDLPPIL